MSLLVFLGKCWRTTCDFLLRLYKLPKKGEQKTNAYGNHYLASSTFLMHQIYKLWLPIHGARESIKAFDDDDDDDDDDAGGGGGGGGGGDGGGGGGGGAGAGAGAGAGGAGAGAGAGGGGGGGGVNQKGYGSDADGDGEWWTMNDECWMLTINDPITTCLRLSSAPRVQSKSIQQY